MKESYLFLIILCLLSLSQCQIKSQSEEQNLSNTSDTPKFEGVESGDIIFHTSLSSQSAAITWATESPYTHVGIIYRRQANAFVFEAVQPVKLTPLKEWIKRGKDEHYVIKRLKNAQELLTPELIQKMQNYGQQHLGKNYDMLFKWSDDQIYCSELVWKIYAEAAGIHLNEPRPLSEYNLSSPEVSKQLEERHGVNLPMDELMIAPSDIFQAKQLVEVKRGNGYP